VASSQQDSGSRAGTQQRVGGGGPDWRWRPRRRPTAAGRCTSGAAAPTSAYV